MTGNVETLMQGRRAELGILAASVVVIAVCCAAPFALPVDPATLVLTIGATATQLVAYALYCRLYAYHHWQKADGADSGSGSRLRDPRALFALPVVATLLALPAVLTGAIDLDGLSAPRVIVIILVLGAGTIPFAFLALIFCWAPVELAVRGVLLLVRGRPGSAPYLVAAAGIAGVTALVVTGAAAVNTSSSGRREEVGFEIFAALLGLPGQYRVDDPVLLVVARAIGVALVLGAIGVTVAHRKDRARRKAETAGAGARPE